MKKYILGIFIFLACMQESNACDICGCGAGNSYIGILPDFRKHIFGVRYRYNFLRTHVGPGGITSYLTTDESYRTAEVWTGWSITSKIRVMAILPYNFDEKETLTSKVSKSGIGDISVAGYYQLINSRKNLSNKLLVQSLWIGAGIKLPTGKYESADKSNNNETANLFQLGTGSTDFSLNAMYDLRVNDAGINLAGSYKINTKNNSGYEYGNKFSLNSQAYYKIRVKNKFTLAPNAGVLFESSQKDIDNGFEADLSGGNLLTGSAGMEITFKKIALGVNFQTPFTQDLADGFVRAKNRGMMHVAFTF